MGLGILEDRHLEHVPGTGYLPGEKDRNGDGADGGDGVRGVEREGETPLRQPSPGGSQPQGLKYDKTGKILLVPQPSDDPNDPLNWPLHHRDAILATLSLTAIIATTLSPLLAADTVTLAMSLPSSLTDTALLTGYHLLGVGMAGFLFVPSARIWGKRHLYILGTVVVVVGSVWGGVSSVRGGRNAAGREAGSYGSLLAARVVQGIGLAPFEALVNASVGDLYCVHERGVRMAVSNLAVFGGAFFTPVVVGVVSDRLGIEWTFYFVAIFMAAMLPLIIFFVPETAFTREQRFDIDTMGNLITAAPAKDEERTVRAIAPKATWKQSLAPFNGRKTEERYLHLLLRPFSLFLHPGILWACLIQGTLIGWTVMIGVVLAGIMLGPPLWFGEVETGYMYTGAFIGALIGFAISGLMADWSARLLTRRNGGVYEPEFRMVLVVPQLVLGCAGLYGFGVTASDAGRFGWFWPDFFFGMVVAGMVCGAVGSALYVVDGYRDMSIEGFTCLLVFKNLFSFGLTFKGFDWIMQGDIKPVFMAIASVQVGICALTIPMYIFGKKNRSFFWRHNVFFKVTDWIADRLTFW